MIPLSVKTAGSIAQKTMDRTADEIVGGRNAIIGEDSLSNDGKRFFFGNLFAIRIGRRIAEKRDSFSRVIGSRMRRIVSVIGSHEKKVLLADVRQKLAESLVEGFDGLAVADWIATMSIEGIEFDEIDEAEAVERLFFTQAVLQPLLIL